MYGGPIELSWAYDGLLGAMFGALGKHATCHALSEYPRCALKSVKYEAKTLRDSPGWSLRCVSAACAVVGEWGFFEPRLRRECDQSVIYALHPQEGAAYFIATRSPPSPGNRRVDLRLLVALSLIMTCGCLALLTRPH